MNKKKLLFAAYGGGHIKMLIKILKSTDIYKEYDVCVLALTTAILECEKNNIKYITYSDFLDDDRKAIRYGKYFNSQLSHKLLPEIENISYMGMSYLDLVNRIGKKQAKQLYNKIGRHAFLQYEIAKKILLSVKPDILISTNSPKTERALFETARDLNIKSVCIMDLFGLDFNWYSHKYATIFCVISEKVKTEFCKYHNIGLNKVFVTGNPNFKHKAIRDEPKYILFASQPIIPTCPFTNIDQDVNLGNKSFELLKNICKKHNYNLKIRFHPNEKPPSGISDKYIDNEDLTFSLAKAKILITFNSTVTLEAWKLGIPVINLNLLPSTKIAPFSEYGYSHGVYNLNDLETVVLDVMNGKIKNKKNKNLEIPDEASENIYNIIKCLN